MKQLLLILICLFVSFLTTSNIVYAWSDTDKQSFFYSCFTGMTSDETIPQTTASRFCNCSTNTISRVWTVKEMEDMIKKGKWGVSNYKKLQEISDLCATGDYE